MCDRGNHREGEKMTTLNTEEPKTAQSTSTAAAKPSKKPPVSERRVHVAPAKAKSGKKAGSAKRAPKSGKKAGSARSGSKTARVLDLLKQPGGVTSEELMKATGWQAHSVRGFLSGTVAKKMGLTVTSTKDGDGERRYSVKA